MKPFRIRKHDGLWWVTFNITGNEMPFVLWENAITLADHLVRAGSDV